MALLSSIKHRVPWYGKIAAKMALSRIPLAYRLWKRASLFEHGPMNNPSYALRIFGEHLSAVGGEARASGETWLELGPGDSLFSGIIGHAHGVAKTYLVDVGDFASRDVAAYRNLVQALHDRGQLMDVSQSVESVDDVLNACGVHYLTEGLQSLRSIQDNSVDVVWSQAVLEHVPLGQFDDVMREIRRILRPGGICSHQVDLADHLGGALNNLRFSDARWESPLFADSGFYTNRIRFSDMCRRFQDAGFVTDVTNVLRWPTLPTPRDKIDSAFSDLPDDELRIREFGVLLRSN